jgi:hypothetical protein
MARYIIPDTKGDSKMNPKFSAKDYNFVAKRIREQNWHLHNNTAVAHATRYSLTELALDLAEHYADDNDRFDPLRFLDACSPDPDQMPLSELWDNRRDKYLA